MMWHGGNIFVFSVLARISQPTFVMIFAFSHVLGHCVSFIAVFTGHYFPLVDLRMWAGHGWEPGKKFHTFGESDMELLNVA